jgi:hypothetical protein
MTKTMYERLEIAPGDIPEIDTLVHNYGQYQIQLNEAEKVFCLYNFGYFVDDLFFEATNQETARPKIRKELEPQLEMFRKLPKSTLLKLIIIYAEDLLSGVYQNDTNYSLSKR